MRKKGTKFSFRIVLLKIVKTQTQFSLKLVIQTIFILFLSKQTFHVHRIHVTWFFISPKNEKVRGVFESAVVERCVRERRSMLIVVHLLSCDEITFGFPHFDVQVVCWSKTNEDRMKRLCGWAQFPIESPGTRSSLGRRRGGKFKIDPSGNSRQRRQKRKLEMWPN